MVWALTRRFRLSGGSPPCSTSHFGVRVVPRRSRTNPQQDRPWSTLTMRWSSGLDVGTQRPERFDHTCYISRVIQVLMYVIELCIYVCMYLPQAISRPPSIGAQSDFLQCTNRGQESWFEPSVVAFGAVVGPLLAQTHIWRQSAASKPDQSSAGSAVEHHHHALELRAGCRNPAL